MRTQNQDTVSFLEGGGGIKRGIEWTAYAWRVTRFGKKSRLWSFSRVASQNV